MRSNYYVYLHKNPETNQVVYVGKGTHGRAWDVTRSRAGNKGHMAWMKDLSNRGFIPSDWVVVFKRGLTENEAFKKELEYLHNHGPLTFNMQCGDNQHQAKLTNDEAKEIFRLAWSGEFLRSELAVLFNISPSNVSMIKHKKQWKTVLREETNENYERSLR